MLSSTLMGLIPLTSEPVDALMFQVDTTDDLMGSGTNLASLDKVVVKDGTIRLDTEVYPIRDSSWSDSNSLNMVVDNQNIPKLDLASHWTTQGGFNGDGSYAHSVVWDSSRSQVYLFGGAHFTGSNFFIHSNVWEYEPGTRSWSDQGAINRPKLFHNAVWADRYDMMIVWGGLTLSGQNLFMLNETLAYYPGNNSWVALAPSPFGARVWSAAAWDPDNNQMLVVGGTRTSDLAFDNATADLFAFRPATNSWHRLASLPANQARLGATAVWDTQNDQMIVYGGIFGGGNPMSSTYSYKPSTNSWTPRSNGDRGFVFHSASWDPVQNRMLTYGGWESGPTRSARYYEYKPLQDVWSGMESAPARRYWSGLIWDPTDSLGLVFGGANEIRQSIAVSSRNDVFEYTPEVPFQTDGWLTSAMFDVAGAVSVGDLSWSPASQPTACGPDAVKFQVATSSMMETPTNFVGPDGTPDTYFTDPAGTAVGDYHFGAGRIAYRMYFHTDDDTISPRIDSVSLDVFRYASRGTYVSPIHDLDQTRSSLERVTYRSEVPDGANTNLVKVDVRIRTSDNADMSSPSSWEDISKDDTTIDIPFGRYFQFEVTLTSDSLKRHETPLFRGITLDYNSPPFLTLGQIDRVDGDRTTWFTYTITYSDVDDDEPEFAYIYIDGIPHEMSSGDFTFTDGAAYSYTTRLGLGNHEFHFEFSDGKNVVRDPPVGVFTGPEILNRDPVAIIDFPSSGERFTPTEPVEFSGSSSYDPDLDDIEFRWISTISGELSTSSAFIKTMTEGSHVITLEVTDQHGTMVSTEIAILVKPYLPYLEISEMYLDKPEPTEKDRVTVNSVVYNEGEAHAGPAIVEFLVNDEVVDSREQSLDVGERMVSTFIWTATGERSYLAVRTRSGHGGGVDDEVIRTVNVTANSPPDINVDVYPLEVTIGNPVNFINNKTSDVNGDSLTFEWIFGDGQTSADATTQHLYALTGSYNVELKVTDTRGGESTQQWIVTIKEKPEDTGSGLSTVMLGGIALAIIVLVGIVAFVLSRRKGEPQEPEDEAVSGPEGHAIAPAEEPTPRRRPLPPPPPPPAAQSHETIPGSPLEDPDNPYYHEEETEPVDYEGGLPDDGEIPVDEDFDPSTKPMYDPSPVPPDEVLDEDSEEPPLEE
jgi:hypothetical protein